MGQRLPRLLESLCLCYLATLLLQTSLSLGDIHRFVDFLAVKDRPADDQM